MVKIIDHIQKILNADGIGISLKNGSKRGTLLHELGGISYNKVPLSAHSRD